MEKTNAPARVIIAVDPAGSNHSKSDETGIIVVAKGEDGNAYVLEDLSGKHAPTKWPQIVVEAYHHFKADMVIIETNKGGNMATQLLRQHAPHLPIKEVHARASKYERALPVASLYEQRKVFHARPFEELENQLLRFEAKMNSSPDRVDALVHGLRELFLTERPPQFFRIWHI